MIEKLLRVAAIGMFVVTAGPILLVGGLFAWKLISSDDYERTFHAPHQDWSIRLEEDCLIGPCHKYGHLIVPNGFLSTQTLQCELPQLDTSRIIFREIQDVHWSEDDTKFSWTSADPANDGSLDIAKQCYDTAVHDDRSKQISIRFRENCVTGTCVRSARWASWRGGFVYTTPCSVTATGTSLVFTLPGDVTGQIDVEVDAGAQTADWRSTGTGQSGQIVFAKDCDLSLQTKKPVPP